MTLPKNLRWIAFLMLASHLLSTAPCHAQNSPAFILDNANWTATDDLGRSLPTYADVGDPKPDRTVGLFYWQWHDHLRAWTSYNITEWMKTHPGFKDWVINPPGGPEHPEWYWAEPLFGYYKSTDPWVIRKHLCLFADAGVDFLFLDYTNASIYDTELGTLLEVARDLKSKGVHVPRLAFFLNFQPEWKEEALYKTWYKPGKWDDLWFKWQGKPLILGPRPTDASKFKDPALLSQVQDYFTWRPTWAFHDAAKEPTKWRFMDKHPQRPALGPDGKIEQMVVSKSLGGPIWDNMQKGSVSSVPGFVPTYDDQWLTDQTPKGLFFEEQWKVARQVAAPILLVTGWNEWTAAVWETPGVVFLGRTTGPGQGHIVDEFNMEFNRDLEPMKGGYNDNYYWQFVANMRRYKGMQAPQPASKPKTIHLNGRFTDWDDVAPTYQDAVGDTAIRDWDGTVKGAHYTDRSARNDLAAAKVARNKSTVFFYVSTAAPLTASTDKNWMMLLIDADANTVTGWHGYDFLVNRSRNGQRCSLERNVGGAWKWEKIADVPIQWSGNQLEIAIPRRLLTSREGATNHGIKLDFKWADNIPDNPDIMDFYSQGDVAPDARFNYRYEAR